MATAGKVTVTGLTPVVLFEGACTEFTIWNDGPVPILIVVEGMHEPLEGFSLFTDDHQRFRVENMGIYRVTGTTAVGPAALRFGVTGNTERED